MNRNFRLFIFLLLLVGFTRCTEKTPNSLFVKLSPEKTGIEFTNEIKQSKENHVLNYSYFYNGGGVAAGDINNDGLVDIYFSGNQTQNKLYLNKGNLKFEDITEKAGVAVPTGWKTGVTMADVNLDGWLDIYVCRSASDDSLLRKNQLFINNKDLTFTEMASKLGVDDDSYSTHAAFFDYDNDHDLDLFVLNHSLPRYAGFSRLMGNLKKESGEKFGSKLFRNENGKFKNVSDEAGLINNVLSFGLGLAVSDLNQDGYLDLYISNDFNEEDYLYINNKNGTFTNTIRSATEYVSLFSMGSDVADINNDGLTDIYTLDMLPASNERIKLSSGDDNYDKYQILIEAGFHHQTTRNMLHLNNGDGTFSEIGQAAGISNTDWSWSALFTDFDGDGWKDLYISNGYEKDYTNMQFLKFTVDEQLKSRQTGAPLNVENILTNIPSINEGNFVFRNNGNLSFSNNTIAWGLSEKVKTNGAAYADLDNDGDQDLILNAMNTTSIVYQNTSVENMQASYVLVDLLKNNSGTNVIGTKLRAYTPNNMQYIEFSPVRGYESSMYSSISIGLGAHKLLDSLVITWPDGRVSKIAGITAGTRVEPSATSALAANQLPQQEVGSRLFDSVSLIDWRHLPSPVNDFKRQVLLPHMYSYAGSKIIKGDVNNDGYEDVFVCGAAGQSSELFIQQKNGTFKTRLVNAFIEDKDFQDENAVFFDCDGDKDLDLYVVGGGYLFNTSDVMLQDRIYKNDGLGNFKKVADALPVETEAGSVVVPFDLDGDNDMDLFVGGRITPGQYPVSPGSFLLINDGTGKFSDKTNELAARLHYTGMVTDAVSTDLNADGFPDLILAGEWLPIQVWMNHSGILKNETTTWFPYPNTGWWNSIKLSDIDKDGDQDLIAGNEGINNQFSVSDKTPVTLVFKDFNYDNQVDPFLCYYINGTAYPYASRDEALAQVNFLKPRYPDYVSYANATLTDIFKPEELKDTVLLSANELRTLVFVNNGKSFDKVAMPVQAQWSPIYAIETLDINADGLEDVIMGGNESYVRVRLGQNGSNKGLVFLNKGNGKFEYMENHISGMYLQGNVRQVLAIGNSGSKAVLIGAVGQPLRSFSLKKK